MRSSPDPAASVVIATRNRRDDVLRAIDSVMAQTVPVEVIVIDDASTDGTSDAIGSRFPDVSVQRLEERRGYIVNRNHGARLARAPIWITMDDDAEMPSPNTVEQTVRAFHEPRIGAVTIPYVESARPERVLQRSPSPPGDFVTSMFIGCAGAMRRDVFLGLGGFQEALVDRAEESDFCLRLLDAGFVVALGRADAMVHHVSDKRDHAAVVRHCARSDLLVTYYNVPLPSALPRAAINVLANLRGAARQRHLGAWLRGVVDAARATVPDRSLREPVRRSTYRLYRSLEHQMTRQRYRLRLQDIVPMLPPPPSGDGGEGPQN